MQSLKRNTRSVARQNQRAIDALTAEIMFDMATQPPRPVEVLSKEELTAALDALAAEATEPEADIVARINERFC